MIRNPTTRSASLVLGALLAISSAPAGVERALPPERPDDPPAAVRARDGGERSPGLRVAVGPYVSVQVNVDELGQNIVGDAANEPSIAVDPTDRSRIAIGWRQFDSILSNFRQAGWAYSDDRGATWTFPGVLTPGTFRSDPVLDTDTDGNFYYQSLDESFALDVFRSFDSAATWLAPADSFGGDKNWMTIDKSGGASDGHVYGIWQRFFGCCGLDTFTRSTNDAVSFETPVDVDRYPTFGTLAVGPDGEVYAAGIDGVSGQNLSVFVVARSDTARVATTTPFFAGSTVNLGGSMRVSAGPNPAGLLGQAYVDVDRSDGPTRGNVYLLASVLPSSGPSDPTDVHFVRSADGGRTWSAPLRVNDDPTGNGAWQWFGALAVAPDGRIDVIWNDTRASGTSNVSELYYAWSWDAGTTWRGNLPVSPPFNSHLGWPNQNKLGDYYTLVSDATGADVAYAATFNGEQDVYYLRLFPDCDASGASDPLEIAEGLRPDCNLNGVPDSCEAPVACPPAGSAPDGAGVPGTALHVDRAGADLALTWGESCLESDGDYAIYEGTLGDFGSHVPRVCTTGGTTESVLTPGAGDRYYLVVPRNAGREGSYGLDGQGDERPSSGTACLPQEIGTCPVGDPTGDIPLFLMNSLRGPEEHPRRAASL